MKSDDLLQQIENLRGEIKTYFTNAFYQVFASPDYYTYEASTYSTHTIDSLFGLLYDTYLKVDFNEKDFDDMSNTGIKSTVVKCLLDSAANTLYELPFNENKYLSSEIVDDIEAPRLLTPNLWDYNEGLYDIELVADKWLDEANKLGWLSIENIFDILGENIKAHLHAADINNSDVNNVNDFWEYYYSSSWDFIELISDALIWADNSRQYNLKDFEHGNPSRRETRGSHILPPRLVKLLATLCDGWSKTIVDDYQGINDED